MANLEKKKEAWADKARKILTGQKQVKKVFVTSSATEPGKKINLVFRNRAVPKSGESDDQNSVIFWMELDEQSAKKLINDITTKLRLMQRYSIEKGE